MKPVKNIYSPLQYKGICSGIIYTLQYFSPCGSNELKKGCKDSLCYASCMAHVSYIDRHGDERSCNFNAKGMETWRIKNETN